MERDNLKEDILFKVLDSVFESLSKIVGTNCEITLHDLRKPLEHSIIKIKNGYITGRNLGGPQAAPGVKYIKRKCIYPEDLETDLLHVTRSGRTIRGSVSVFKNEQNEPVAMLSIIYDVTNILKIITSSEDLLGITNTSLMSMQGPKPLLQFNDVGDKIAQLADETISKVGKPISDLAREDKIGIVKELKDAGFFKVKGSIKVISAKLNSSKFTIYNYLNSDGSD